jgi:hypothetical protein
LEKLKSEMQKLEAIEKQVLASPDKQISLTDPDARLGSSSATWRVKRSQWPNPVCPFSF